MAIEHVLVSLVQAYYVGHGCHDVNTPWMMCVHIVFIIDINNAVDSIRGPL